MITALIVSKTPFLSEVLSSCRDYKEQVTFDTKASFQEGYDLYIYESVKAPPITSNAIHVTRTNNRVLLREVVEAIDAFILKQTSVSRYEGLELNLFTKTLKYNELSQSLTEIEAKILHAIITNTSSELSRDSLLQGILGYNENSVTHSLENHIYKLRKKLESMTQNLKIIKHNDGYKITRS